MSGIYIPMEMPDKGEFKHIRIYDNGDVTVQVDDGEAVIAHAVPVPEHGPLVEALEVINTFPEEFIFTNEQARALTNYIVPADTADKEGEG